MPLFALEHSTLLTEAEKAEVRGKLVPFLFLGYNALRTSKGIYYLSTYGKELSLIFESGKVIYNIYQEYK